MSTTFILSDIANVIHARMVRSRKQTFNTFWVIKHIHFLLNNWQTSRMYRKTNFVQTSFSNTTKTSSFSSF